MVGGSGVTEISEISSMMRVIRGILRKWCHRVDLKMSSELEVQGDQTEVDSGHFEVSGVRQFQGQACWPSDNKLSITRVQNHTYG